MCIAKKFKICSGDVAVNLAVLCPFSGAFFMSDK
jgi:hypothetical protein